MTRRPGLSIPAHEALGLELYHLRTRLIELSVQVGHAYGTTSSRLLLRRYDEAVKALDALRSALEDQLYTEHGDQARLDIYFPGGKIAARHRDGAAEEGTRP